MAANKASGKNKLDDISRVADEISKNGLKKPDQLIMGIKAFENLVGDTDITDRFDTSRVDLGASLG